MTYDVVCADVLEWAAGYEGELFHAILCDPPYGLTQDRRKSVCNRIARALADVSFPDFNEHYAKFFEQVDLAGIPLDGSLLSRRKVAAVINTGVGVPESAVDFNDGIVIGEPEVSNGSEPPEGVTEEELMDEVDIECGQFIGDYILDTRDTLDLAASDILGGDFAEFTSGSFAVPITLLFPEFSEPLASFLQENAPCFADVIGLGDNTTSEAKTSPTVLTDSRTENTLMLRLDLRRRALELFATYRASKSNGCGPLGSPKLIRAIPPASGLSTPSKPYRVRLVLPLANGARSSYFIHLWLHKDLWDKLTRIIPQKGFMGKQWDAALPDPEMWRQITRHLHPGGFLMAFASPRTYDQLARDLREIGMILHPAIGWLNGAGFPKATRIDTQIDKAAGAEREVVGKKAVTCGTGKEFGKAVGTGHKGTVIDITAPATPLAAQWEGHRYGLQAIKPALEFIALAQKPYEGKPVESITSTGAGALWIDGGRIGHANAADLSESENKNQHEGYNNPGSNKDSYSGDYPPRQNYSGNGGRWPANFALCHVAPDEDGNGGCMRDGVRRVKGITGGMKPINTGVSIGTFEEKEHRPFFNHADADGNETVANFRCVEGCPVKALGEQSGDSVGSHNQIHRAGTGTSKNVYGELEFKMPVVQSGYNDKGSKARFFHNADWSYEVAERLAASDAVKYQAKSSRRERDAGLDGMPAILHRQGMSGKMPIDDDGKERDRFSVIARNNHPCCKPIALTQWLATLLLPPDAYAPRRILNPFSGSGSEAIGAMLAGWEHITLVEMDSDYCDIARARLAWWAKQADGQMWPNVKQILKNAK